MKTPRAHALAALVAALGASCGGDSPQSHSDAGPDGDEPPVIVEPEIPPADCDVAFDRVYEIPGTTSARANAVTELPNGHFVVAGSATPEEPATPYDRDGFLMEVDGDGEVVWTRTYSGTDAGDKDKDVDVFYHVFTMGTGLVAFGRTEENGSHGVWMHVTDGAGDVVSSKRLSLDGGMGTFYKIDDGLYLFSTTEKGQVVVATVDAAGNLTEVYREPEDIEHDLHGYYLPLSTGYHAFWGWLTSEVDGTSYEPFPNVYRFPDISFLDSGFEMSAWAVLDPGRSGAFSMAVETNDGQVLAGGWLLWDDWFYGTYLAKVTVTGEVSWQRFYGYNDLAYLQDMARVGNDYLLTAYYTGGIGSADAIVARVDGDGNLLWRWKAGHTGSAQLSVGISTTSGDYFFCGATKGGVSTDDTGYRPWLVKITPNEECY